MGKHVQWIAYKGKEILFMNAAGLAADEGIAAWEEMRQELLKERAVHLILVDATNARIERGPLEKAREVVGVAKKGPGIPVAFVGMNNTFLRTTAQLMATRLRLHACFCATQEEGKEWLVKEEDKRPGVVHH
jgi:hypothetical protein